MDTGLGGSRDTAVKWEAGESARREETEAVMEGWTKEYRFVLYGDIYGSQGRIQESGQQCQLGEGMTNPAPCCFVLFFPLGY